MSNGFKFLVVVDDSAEFPAALTFAALRAKATGGGLVMLAVIEPVEAAGWASVDAQIRLEALASAHALTQQFAAEAKQEADIDAQIEVREGETRAEIRALLDEDQGIRYVVLAAGAGAAGPGPLVSSLAKGGGLGGRLVPVVVVPGALSREELRALAAPLEAS
jgi:hypothetical protein